MFDDLDPGQRRAATHGEGPLLIVAGAGTGKTTTLAARVAFLLDEGVRPERMLLLTFSRRAARELVTKAHHQSGHPDAERVWGGTFHAVANRLLRLQGRAIGLSPDFTVLDQTDGADLMDLLRDDLGLSARERRFPKKQTLVSIYSRTVNAGEKLGDVLTRAYPWCAEEADGIREVFRAYTERKRRQHVLDYDDLLLFWKALMASTAGAEIVGMFDHVLVDEYQDTNALQADVIELLRPAEGPRNLTVVGDDAQAIYGFRAATVRNILGFTERFPGATVIPLERNFRSTPPLLAASNAVIALAPERLDKTLWSDRTGTRRPTLRTCLDETEQSEAVCRQILEHREEGVPLKEQAVLFRAAHHSDLLEVELLRRNVPFVKYGGLKFLEAAHVKDALALLRVLENPRDEVAWFRVLQLPDGMGPGTARRVIARLDLGADDAGLARFLEAPIEVPKAAATGVRSLRAALADCAGADLPPAAELDRLRAFLDPVLASRYRSAEARSRDLEQLAHLASGSANRQRFLADLTLDPPSSTGDLAGPPVLDEDWLTLSTIHSAKGLEWDVVFVIHAADGHIPSDMATGDPDEIEEERRLLYVAMTRARDALHVSFPQRYYRRPTGRDDAHSYAQRSRFLPEEILTHFDLVAPDLVALGDEDRHPDDGAVPAGAAAASVDAFLSGLWAE